MTEAESILGRLESLMDGTNASHRDNLLEVGGLLHQYVLSRLKEGDGLTEGQRQENGLTREAVVRVAAARLGTTPAKANTFIIVAKAVGLLSDGLPLGKVSWSMLLLFAPFVRRRTGRLRRSACDPAGGVEVSSFETWEVKGDADTATGLFRQAVEGQWSSPRTMAEMRRVRRVGKAVPKGKASPFADDPDHYEVGGKTSGVDLMALARMSTPRDLAELISTMISQSSQPGLVRDLVLSSIGRPGLAS